MPVTSADSLIKRWPSAEVVLSAVRAWAREAAEQRPDLIALGYCGSYARGAAGFGSDLDLIAVVGTDNRPAMERSLDWPTEALPVPADLLVYTLSEWKQLQAEGGRFGTTLRAEARWLVGREALPRLSGTQQGPPTAPPSVAGEAARRSGKTTTS